MRDFLPTSKKEALQIVTGCIIAVPLIIGFAWGFMALAMMITGVE